MSSASNRDRVAVHLAAEGPLHLRILQRDLGAGGRHLVHRGSRQRSLLENENTRCWLRTARLEQGTRQGSVVQRHGHSRQVPSCSTNCNSTGSHLQLSGFCCHVIIVDLARLHSDSKMCISKEGKR